MKKRLFAVTLVICLVAAMGLTGCGSSNAYDGMNFDEYVEVGKYTGLEKKDIKVSVSDEEVQTQIEVNLENTTENKEVTKGEVKDGDVANIDYEGKKDGVAFEGGTAQGYDLEIGSGSFIPGFEDGLIGKSIGDTVELELTFPEDYSSEDLAGQDVVFTVKINSVSRPEVPEYTVDWVKANSDVDTKEDYEKLVKDQLKEDKIEEEKNNIMAELWNEVLADSTVIKYPQEQIDVYVAEIEAGYASAAESYGMSLEELLEAYGMDEEAYNAQNEKAAQDSVKSELVMYAIAEKEGLAYTDEEAESLKASIETAGYTDETFKQDYGQEIDAYIDAALTFNLVAEFIYDNAVTK